MKQGSSLSVSSSSDKDKGVKGGMQNMDAVAEPWATMAMMTMVVVVVASHQCLRDLPHIKATM